MVMAVALTISKIGSGEGWRVRRRLQTAGVKFYVGQWSVTQPDKPPRRTSTTKLWISDYVLS